MKTSSKTGNYQLAFKLITMLIPLIILAGIEGILRLSNYGDDFSLFVQNPESGYEEYMMLNPDVGKKYFQKLEYTEPGNDIFLKEKPENTFRIFVMGSSTVYGFPYDGNLMFSRILNQQLEEAFTEKSIEVVNTAITAINSYTLLDFTDQILAHEPDAILIYAGHNEFYGAFGVGSNETMSRNRNLTRLHIALLDFKVYQLLRNVISGLSQKLATSSGISAEGTLMKRIVDNNDIQYGSKEYTIGIESYQRNMEDILMKINDKNIPVFFSEVVCNVKGMEPFSTETNSIIETAIDVYREAQKAEANQEYAIAKELYYKAKDLDGVRFRASEDINKVINNLSAKYNVHLVPMLAIFQENSPNGLIGNNLMTEHVHPNIDGYFIMADAFFSEILKSGIVGEPVLSQRITLDYIKKNYGYTILDSLAGNHRIQLLKGNWPFVNFGEEINYAKVYQPKNFLDSIAFEVLKNEDLSLGTARYQLARKYDESGDYINAYKEYEALLHTTPYVSKIYRDAATALMNLSDMPKALNYLQKSLVFEETGYAYAQIAEIFFIMGDYDQSAAYFQKALPLVSDDNKNVALMKIYACFVYGNEPGPAQEVAKNLAELGLERYLSIPPKEYVFNQYIPFQTKNEVLLAKQIISESKNSEALLILESSLNDYDSHMANRLIGEIYIKQGDLQKALFFYEKVYQWFRFDPKYLFELALIYHSVNNSEKANQCLQAFIEIDPTNSNLEMLKSILSEPN